MTETVKVFACPKCGLIIEHGKTPCPYCGTTIAWEGFSQVSDEATSQIEVQNTSSLYDSGLLQTQSALDLSSAKLSDQDYSTPIVEVDYGALDALDAGAPAVSSPSSSYAPKSNNELLIAATSPVLDSVDYAAQQQQNSELLLQQQQDQLALQQEKLKEQQRLLEEEQKRLAEQESLLQEQKRLEQERLEHSRLEQERLEQARLEQARLDQQRLLEEQQRLEQERLLQEQLVEQQKRDAMLAEAQATAASTLPRDTAPLPDLPPLKNASNSNGYPLFGLPETPPIKDSSTALPTYLPSPPRPRKRSAAVVAASVIMKIIAVIAWIVAIVFFVVSSETVIAAMSPFSLETLIDILASDQKIKIGISCVIFGFLFFGVGVIIGLLGDIRRGAR